jgi:hypothetical protein
VLWRKEGSLLIL